MATNQTTISIGSPLPPSSPTHAQQNTAAELPQDVEADTDGDSAYAESDGQSSTASIGSIFKGYYENGRRYQNVRDVEYMQPTDEQQWDSMSAGNMLMLILNSQLKNPLFRSPLSDKAQNIIDLGTGNGDWALDCADKFPQYTVHGVDLFPPPHTWTAPNCVFEVDDITKNWTWKKQFDLVHMRYLLGAFNTADWKALLRKIYENTAPGGWVEHTEMHVGMFCDDGTLPADSVLSTWGDDMTACAERAGRPVDTMDTMRERIEEAGFINVQQQDYKMPVGTWPKLQVYKDAGIANKEQLLNGLEGYCMFLLTKFGAPKPWSVEDVKVLVEKAKRDLDNPRYHLYNKARRVWAMKPFDK